MIFKMLSVLACPMCADLVERGRGAFAAMRFGEGISWSIVLMLSVPALLAGTFTFFVWRGSRRAAKEAHERTL